MAGDFRWIEGREMSKSKAREPEDWGPAWAWYVILIPLGIISAIFGQDAAWSVIQFLERILFAGQ